MCRGGSGLEEEGDSGGEDLLLFPLLLLLLLFFPSSVSEVGISIFRSNGSFLMLVLVLLGCLPCMCCVSFSCNLDLILDLDWICSGS